MLHRINQFRRYRSYLNPYVIKPFDAQEAKEDTHEARQLHAQTYLVRGYVSGHEIDSDGIITSESDPYGAFSRYFCVVTSGPQGERKVVAAARLIEARSGLGHDSFQTWREQELSPVARALIKTYGPHECAEVSALVKNKGVSTEAVLHLYRALWQYSLIHGQKLWIMSCDISLLKRLTWLFGSAIEPIGEAVFFKGHTVIPVMINIPLSLGELLRSHRRLSVVNGLRRDVARFFLYDLPSSALSDDQQVLAQQLKARIV